MTEVRASGSTAPFQLGGATDEVLQTGVELGAETRLLYLLPLQLRLGLARALDEPKGTRGDLTLGRAFWRRFSGVLAALVPCSRGLVG